MKTASMIKQNLGIYFWCDTSEKKIVMHTRLELGSLGLVLLTAMNLEIIDTMAHTYYYLVVSSYY